METVPLLFVSDIDKSCEFYCDGLGFDAVQRWEPEGQLAWCRIENDGAALMLQQACDEDPPADARGKGVAFYFICEDVDAVYHEISQRGVQASQQTVAFYSMKQTFLRDPDGYELCFESPVEPAKA